MLNRRYQTKTSVESPGGVAQGAQALETLERLGRQTEESGKAHEESGRQAKLCGNHVLAAGRAVVDLVLELLRAAESVRVFLTGAEKAERGKQKVATSSKFQAAAPPHEPQGRAGSPLPAGPRRGEDSAPYQAQGSGVQSAKLLSANSLPALSASDVERVAEGRVRGALRETENSEAETVHNSGEKRENERLKGETSFKFPDSSVQPEVPAPVETENLNLESALSEAFRDYHRSVMEERQQLLQAIQLSRREVEEMRLRLRHTTNSNQ